MITGDDILHALRLHAGIDAVQTGEATLRKEIQRAIEACEHPHRLLDPATPEWKDLLESALVPETWFFRNVEAFQALGRWLSGSWRPAHPESCLRILSLPCATGEEPYSLAMWLAEAGAGRFRILAGDISERSLATARAACYRRNSFRSGFDEERFGKYFEQVGDGSRRVCGAIRSMVDFESMNLAGPQTPIPPADVIFCRNALIYFGVPAQIEALARLHAALSDDGILFLGPVEPPLALQCGFVSAGFPMAFACLKGPAKSEEPAPAMLPSPGPRRVRKPSRLPAPPAVPACEPDPFHRDLPAADSLESARALADAGDMDAAAGMLDRLAATSGPTPGLFYLRGVLSEALGRADLAEAAYRKALYLDPAHHESLAQLSLLLELGGRAEVAARMRRRAANLLPQ